MATLALLGVLCCQLPLTQAVYVYHPCCKEYFQADASFGPKLPFYQSGVAGRLYNAGTGCNLGFHSRYDTQNRIVLVERGECSFVEKVTRAQDAGALAVIVYDNVNEGELITMGAGPDEDATKIHIPAVFISHRAGVDLVDMQLLESSVMVELFRADSLPYAEWLNVPLYFKVIVMMFSAMMSAFATSIILRHWCGAHRSYVIYTSLNQPAEQHIPDNEREDADGASSMEHGLYYEFESDDESDSCSEGEDAGATRVDTERGNESGSGSGEKRSSRRNSSGQNSRDSNDSTSERVQTNLSNDSSARPEGFSVQPSSTADVESTSIRVNGMSESFLTSV